VLYDEALALCQANPDLTADGQLAQDYCEAANEGHEALVSELEPKVKAVLAEYREPLDLVSQAASMDALKPVPEGGPGSMDVFPGGPVVPVTRLASASAVIEAHDGDLNAALAQVEDLLVFGVRYPAGGPIVDRLKGWHIVRTSCSYSAVPLIRQGDLPVEDLRAFASRVRGLREECWDPASAIHYDGRGLVRMFEHFRENEAEVIEKAKADGVGAEGIATFKREVAAYDVLVPWLNHCFAQLVDEAEKPPWEADLEPLVQKAIEGSEDRSPEFGGDDGVGASFVSLPKAMDRLRQQYALLSALETIALLEAHQRDRGAYPEALPVLVPEYCDVLPLDPWTGQPILYSLESDGSYRLYCTGPDEADDGGIQRPGSEAAPDYIIFPDPPTAEEDKGDQP
jgi:hypothetical protein